MNETYQIENVPLFANLPPAQLDALRKDALRQLYKAGETIFHHGELPEHLYIVEEGVVDIVLPARGEEIILAKAGKPFARLVPLEEARERVPGRYAETTPESFSDDLPEEELRGWEA